MFSQEKKKEETATAAAAAEKHGEGAVQPETGGEEGKKEKSGKNLNIDAKMLYGRYNTIFWSGSIVQNFDKFTYQLNSNFKRSNDFGYKNSRYYVNEIGFTADAEVTDKWKLTPEVSVNNESYGMFRNPFYNREEKDRIILNFKNEYKPMPTRWDITVGGVYFIHRFDSSLYPDANAVRSYHSSDLYKADAELGWEYVWSAANKLRFDSKFSQYYYSTNSDNDTVTANELIWNFNLSEYFKFGLGPLYTYNRDRGNFVSGKIDIVTANLKYVVIGASYRYDLFPFAPEDFYFAQKYVHPYYSLSAGKGHHADFKFGVDYTSAGKNNFYVKKIKFRLSGSYMTNDRYHSYFSLPELVLAPYRMKLQQCKAKAEGGIGFMIYSVYLELGGRYEYAYFYASSHVTYQPGHAAAAYLNCSVWRFELQYDTLFRGAMYASPFFNVIIHKAFIGSGTLQFKVFDSFYLYGRIENVYNIKYNTVYGYPEPGLTVSGGLRIIL